MRHPNSDEMNNTCAERYELMNSAQNKLNKKVTRRRQTAIINRFGEGIEENCIFRLCLSDYDDDDDDDRTNTLEQLAETTLQQWLHGHHHHDHHQLAIYPCVEERLTAVMLDEVEQRLRATRRHRSQQRPPPHVRTRSSQWRRRYHSNDHIAGHQLREPTDHRVYGRTNGDSSDTIQNDSVSRPQSDSYVAHQNERANQNPINNESTATNLGKHLVSLVSKRLTNAANSIAGVVASKDLMEAEKNTCFKRWRKTRVDEDGSTNSNIHKSQFKKNDYISHEGQSAVDFSWQTTESVICNRLMETSANTLAEALTKLDCNTLMPLLWCHLYFTRSNSSFRHNRQLNLAVRHSLHVTDCFVSFILMTEESRGDSHWPHLRVSAISHVISVLQHCYLMNSWHACHCLLAALQSPSVCRLANTWHQLRRRHRQKYSTFTRISGLLTGARSGYSVHKFMLRRAVKMKQPCVVWLGYLIESLQLQHCQTAQMSGLERTGKWRQFESCLKKYKINAVDTELIDLLTRPSSFKCMTPVEAFTFSKHIL